MDFLMGCFMCGSGGPPTNNCDRVCPEGRSTEGEKGLVKRFKWDEIENLTMKFKEVIGVGGYSMVYLVKFSDSSLGAIKIYNSSERLNQVFLNELEICQKLNHPHIVKLLGYSDEREGGALVFEYIPNGNLQDFLHNNSKNITLTWNQRITIAYQLAQTLTHLHENSNPHIIHGDIKSSNILLDKNLDCHLADFGCGRVGFSSLVKSTSSSRVASMIVGSPGYVDPHFIRTGVYSKKSDVYSLGVVLLELITGIEACTCSGERHVLLTSRVKTQESFDLEKTVNMVDKEAFTNYEEVKIVASIARVCLQDLPSLRPSALEICRIMRENISYISTLVPFEKL